MFRNTTELQGYPISAQAPGTGQVLEWNGSLYVPTTGGGGGGGTVFSVASPEGTLAIGAGSGPNVTADLAQQAATTGQALLWNGSQWSPGAVVESISNGYGITGATGATPAPAVSLTSVVAQPTAGFSLVASTTAEMLTAGSTGSSLFTLAPGTWEITFHAFVDAVGTASAVDMWIAAGGTGTPATVSFAGQTVASIGFPATASLGGMLPIRCEATVTVGGTVGIFFQSNKTNQIQVTSMQTGRTTATGGVAVRKA